MRISEDDSFYVVLIFLSLVLLDIFIEFSDEGDLYVFNFVFFVVIFDFFVFDDNDSVCKSKDGLLCKSKDGKVKKLSIVFEIW